MRLLSWNTNQGHGTAAAIELANRVGADALMLQEARPASSWSGETAGALVADRTWGSWVLVRSGVLEPIAIAGYSGWVSGARWQRSDEGDLYVFSVHSPTPTETEPRASYVAESRAIVSAICECVPPTAPLLIGGDFNFKSLGQRLPSETIQTEAAELQALEEFRSHGLAIAWQDCNAGQPLAQTLRWRNNPSRPYHCDGFLTRNLYSVVNCDAIQPDSESPSDHNAVLLNVLLNSAEA